MEAAPDINNVYRHEACYMYPSREENGLGLMMSEDFLMSARCDFGHKIKAKSKKKCQVLQFT